MAAQSSRSTYQQRGEFALERPCITTRDILIRLYVSGANNVFKLTPLNVFTSSFEDLLRYIMQRFSRRCCYTSKRKKWCFWL